MNVSERPTPMTDEKIRNGEESSMTDFARQLERVCAELAEAIEKAPWTNDLFEQALARYGGMMKGVGK